MTDKETQNEALAELHRGYERGDLALFLGAGVSIGTGLPTWEKLVLAMNFAAVSNEEIVDGGGGRWRPFPNYLYAIAEWQLRHRAEPLEITARKLRRYYDEIEARDNLNQGEGQRFFRQNLHRTLYESLLDDEGRLFPEPDYRLIRQDNSTLDAVAALCEAGFKTGQGVQSVITYNYDNLLELVLNAQEDAGRKVPVLPLHSGLQEIKPDTLPVYHVHGLVPLEGGGAKAESIVFTEDEYHQAALDPYSWSNIVQLQAMSNCTGLMVGLSMTDRNIRR